MVPDAHLCESYATTAQLAFVPSATLDLEVLSIKVMYVFVIDYFYFCSIFFVIELVTMPSRVSNPISKPLLSRKLSYLLIRSRDLWTETGLVGEFGDYTLF